MKNLFQRLIMISFLLLIFSASHSQNYLEDIVYLKNGSIIRGLIFEQVPNLSIKIQTADKNIFVFKFDEIEKLTKEISEVPSNNSTIKIKSNKLQKNWYFNITENNFNLGIGNVLNTNNYSKNNDFSFGFRSVNGIKINDRFSLGIGIGIEKHNYFYNSSTLIPISIDSRISFLKGKTSPLISTNVGYAIPRNSSSGTIFFNPQIGIRTYISENIAYLFNIGYKFESYTDSNDYYQYISISTGLSF